MSQNTFITPFFAVARSNRNNTRNRQETFRDFAMDDAGYEFTRNPSNAWRTGNAALAVKIAQELTNSQENAADGWDFYAVEAMERTEVVRIVDELDAAEMAANATRPEIRREICEVRKDGSVLIKGTCDAAGAGEGAAK